MILASIKVVAFTCAVFVFVQMLFSSFAHVQFSLTQPRYHQVRYSRHMDILTAAGFLVMLQAIRRLYAPGLHELYV